jgi:hypothetical protein
MVMRALLIGWLTITSCSASCEMAIGTNFWDVGLGGEANAPFIDGCKNVSGDNPWKPAFLDEIRIFMTFRFMDWGKTNNAVEAHGGKTRWEDRVKKSDAVQRPMADEWTIDLCNRTQRDMWLWYPVESGVVPSACRQAATSALHYYPLS